MAWWHNKHAFPQGLLAGGPGGPLFCRVGLKVVCHLREICIFGTFGQCVISYVMLLQPLFHAKHLECLEDKEVTRSGVATENETSYYMYMYTMTVR